MEAGCSVGCCLSDNSNFCCLFAGEGPRSILFRTETFVARKFIAREVTPQKLPQKNGNIIIIIAKDLCQGNGYFLRGFLLIPHSGNFASSKDSCRGKYSMCAFIAAAPGAVPRTRRRMTTATLCVMRVICWVRHLGWK